MKYTKFTVILLCYDFILSVDSYLVVSHLPSLYSQRQDLQPSLVVLIMN
jgi:hypothetical protein